LEETELFATRRRAAAELSLMTAITSFATALDVTVSELKPEAFSPSDSLTAAALFDDHAQRAGGAPVNLSG
jgi:hypothetical protein